MPATAQQAVAACSAEQRVISFTAIKLVVIFVSPKDVMAGPAQQGVAPGAA